MKRARCAEAGFSLIELMVTVGIVAVLAGIAIPSYSSYTLKAHRADALRALAMDRQIMERCYTQNYAYNNAACPALGATSPGGYYTIATSNLTAATYTLTAAATGNQTHDAICTSISIDQSGTQLVVTGTGSVQTCWGSN